MSLNIFGIERTLSTQYLRKISTNQGICMKTIIMLNDLYERPYSPEAFIL